MPRFSLKLARQSAIWLKLDLCMPFGSNDGSGRLFQLYWQHEAVWDAIKGCQRSHTEHFDHAPPGCLHFDWSLHSIHPLHEDTPKRRRHHLSQASYLVVNTKYGQALKMRYMPTRHALERKPYGYDRGWLDPTDYNYTLTISERAQWPQLDFQAKD